MKSAESGNDSVADEFYEKLRGNLHAKQKRRSEWVELSLETCQIEKCWFVSVRFVRRNHRSLISPFVESLNKAFQFQLFVCMPLFYSLNAWRQDKDAPSNSQHVYSFFYYFRSSAMQPQTKLIIQSNRNVPGLSVFHISYRVINASHHQLRYKWMCFF